MRFRSQGLLGASAVLIGGALLFGLGPKADAADHIDSPAAVGDPSADITDVYAWMTPDGTKLNLILNTFGAAFSDTVQYVFHVTSMSAYGQSGDEIRIICEFSSDQRAQCWVGDDEYIAGDASNTAGLLSESGKVRLFAGSRNDPFYFNLAGFRATLGIVAGAAASLTFDEAGCPALDAPTSTALVTQLSSNAEGGAAADFFAPLSTHSIVLQLDETLVNQDGPVLAVWASTYRK
jgi:hypothetical protein